MPGGHGKRARTIKATVCAVILAISSEQVTIDRHGHPRLSARLSGIFRPFRLSWLSGMAKGLAAVWTDLGPSKPCVPLPIDGIIDITKTGQPMFIR